MFEKDKGYRKARKESKDKITKVIKVWSAREESVHDTAFKDGVEFGYNEAKEEMQELEELVEKYRQAVDKCLHITFMGGGCEVNTIGQYATFVDSYLIDVEGLAKWKK